MISVSVVVHPIREQQQNNDAEWTQTAGRAHCISRVQRVQKVVSRMTLESLLLVTDRNDRSAIDFLYMKWHPRKG
jgi:hypothetical protein